MEILRFAESINNFLDKKDTEFVNLDLGSRYVKGLFNKNGKIKTFFTEESKNNPAQSAIAALKNMGLAGKKVRLGLKGPETIIRYINFPKLDKNSLRESFGYELSKYIPFAPDSVYFDIFVLDENHSKGEITILLAVAKKTLIDSILEELSKEKIQVSNINLIGVAMTNLYFAVSETNINAALLDIGYSSANLNLFHKDNPYLSREIKIAGKIFIDKLAGKLNKEKIEIENMLIENQTIDGYDDLYGELCEEIRNSFDYFEMNVGEQIKCLYLTGAFAKISGIEKAMHEDMGVETKIWQPWEKLNLSLPEDVNIPKEMLTGVIGLDL